MAVKRQLPPLSILNIQSLHYLCVLKVNFVDQQHSVATRKVYHTDPYSTGIFSWRLLQLLFVISIFGISCRQHDNDLSAQNKTTLIRAYGANHLESFLDSLTVYLNTNPATQPSTKISPFSLTLDSIFHSSVGQKFVKNIDNLTPQDRIAFLRDLIYTNRGIVSLPTSGPLDLALPQKVWAQRQGSCLGLSLLWIALGHKFGLPIYGVRLPNHMFVRYIDTMSHVSINIEPNKNGMNHPNEYYIEKYHLQNRPYQLNSIYHPKELWSLLYFEIGNIYYNQSNWKNATFFYEKSLDSPIFYGETMGNLALSYHQMGNKKKSLQLLKMIQQRDPYLPNLTQTTNFISHE